MRPFFLSLIFGSFLFSGCAYRLFPGPLVPLDIAGQVPHMQVRDDGTVAYVHERLEIGLRPLTDEELNRQFVNESKGGNTSTNPYTFGDWEPERGEKPPRRFTVFNLKVKNYTYPKMMVDPLKMTIVSRNGRQYFPLSLAALKNYYYPFLTGYAGNLYKSFETRKDILRRTLYPVNDLVFSGQDREGYVVFPPLDDDVREITVHLEDIILRFDIRGEPVEMVDLEFRFKRDVYRTP